MSSSNLRAVPNPELSAFAYPDNTQTSVVQSEQGEVHDIWGPDANPTANYANAPNGSRYVYKHLTVPTFWVKGGEIGAKDGTWLEIT